MSATLCRGVRTCGFLLAFALMISLWFAPLLRAQSQQQARVPGSELSRENSSLVAASAAQIKTVLAEDGGLMVELKRWMAKDATDQGQIITESDLTEDAIFDRLQTDVRFRSVATLLLQRYGYLLPKVNPDSELGKQQELLVQERVKWIAQEEEQARSQAAARAQDRFEKARQCERGEQSSCSEQQQQRQQQAPASRSWPPQDQGQGTVPGYPPGLENPNRMNPPNFQQGPGAGQPGTCSTYANGRISRRRLLCILIRKYLWISRILTSSWRVWRHDRERRDDDAFSLPTIAER